MNTIDDVSLDHTGLEFSTVDNSDTVIISIKPRWTTDLNNPSNTVYGLFVDDGTPSSNVGMTTEFTVTPTLFTDHLKSIHDAQPITLQSNLVCDSITCDSIELKAATDDINTLSNYAVITKESLIAYTNDVFYSKSAIDDQFVNIGSFYDNLITFDIPNLTQVNSEIESYVTFAVNGGIFSHSKMVMTTDIPNIISSYNLMDSATVNDEISLALDTFDLTSYVRNTDVYTKISEYNTINNIPNE